MEIAVSCSQKGELVTNARDACRRGGESGGVDAGIASGNGDMVAENGGVVAENGGVVAENAGVVSENAGVVSQNAAAGEMDGVASAPFGVLPPNKGVAAAGVTVLADLIGAVCLPFEGFVPARRPVANYCCDMRCDPRPVGEKVAGGSLDGRICVRESRMFKGPVLSVRSSLALVLAISACGGDDLSLPSDTGSVHLELVHGDEQSAPAGERLPDSLVVRLVDPAGQGIAGATVTWVVSDGGGSVTPRTATTDSAGFAVARWTLGPVAGPNTLDALVSQVGLVTFTATGTEDAEPPGEVDRLIYLVPPEDVEVGEQFSVQVALVDVSGDVVPLSGVLIYLGLFEEGQETPSNSRLLGNRFRETVDGVAVFDGLSITEKGRYRLRALTDDLPELGPHGPEPFLFSDRFQVD